MTQKVRSGIMFLKSNVFLVALVALPCTPLPELNPVLQMSHDGVGTPTWTQYSAHTGWVWANCCINCNKPVAQRSSACGHLTEVP